MNRKFEYGAWWVKKNLKKRRERETDLNRAGAAVDGRGQPVDCAIAVNQHIDIEGNIELTVVTVEGNRKTCGYHDYNHGWHVSVLQGCCFFLWSAAHLFMR